MTVIADGILSIKPTVLVSTARLHPLVNTHSLTHLDALRGKSLRAIVQVCLNVVLFVYFLTFCLIVWLESHSRKHVFPFLDFCASLVCTHTHTRSCLMHPTVPADLNVNECLWSRKMSFAQWHRKHTVPSDHCSQSWFVSVCLSLL